MDILENNFKSMSVLKTLLLITATVAIILATLIISFSFLKEEAIKTHIKVAKLHSNTYSEQLTQTMSNIDIIIDSLSTVLNSKSEKVDIDSELKTILVNSAFIRSVSILDNNKKIIKSSEKRNIGKKIDLKFFYPKPIFNEYILRIGTPWMGRDIYNGINLSDSNELMTEEDLSFIPLARKVIVNKETNFILINLNTDYFINRYFENIKVDNASLEILRVDSVSLFSTTSIEEVGLKIDTKLFNDSKKYFYSSGLEEFDGKKYMSAYNLTEIYPLCIGVKIDFDKSLKQWEEKRFLTVLIVSLLLIFCAILILIIIVKNNIEKNRQISSQKKEIKSKQRFQILFEQSMFLAITIKSDGSITQLNQKSLDFLNVENGEVFGKKLWELNCWTYNDAKYLKTEIENFSKNKKLIDKELEVLDSYGRKRILSFNLYTISIDNEIELVAIAFDITEKKEREERLKHAFIVYENTQDGIILTDKDANILNVNNAFTTTTGYEVHEIIRKNANILSSGIHDKSFYEQMWDSLDKEGYWEGELINKKKSGELYTEKLKINAVFDSENKIKNYIAIFSNITKQKEQEKRLKEQEEFIYQQSKMAAMGEMIENIAHQWRQPLSAISSISSSVKLQKELDLISKDEELKNLDQIMNYTNYLSRTIDDFRDFLKTDKPKSSFDITNVINRSLTLISAKLKNREINVISKLENIKVFGIENELAQVLINLLNNACDAFDSKEFEKKYIFIDVFKQGKNCIVYVKDNAGGIPDEIISRIFEPYFTTKHQSQGTGIGLYMSQEIIVHHMNGKIICVNDIYEYDNDEYKGALFKITLPLITED